MRWTELATHDDLALLRSDVRAEMAELRSEMASLESRLQRTLVTWIIAAQGVTIAALSVLITVAMIVVS